MTGERGLASWAMWRHSEITEHQSVIPESLKNPPTGLNVIRFVGNIWLRHVYPVSDTLRQFLPLLNICENRIATSSVEFLHAERFDLFLLT